MSKKSTGKSSRRRPSSLVILAAALLLLAAGVWTFTYTQAIGASTRATETAQHERR